MRAIKNARLFIESDPDSPTAKVLANLVLALESETSFRLSDLYTLDQDHFEWALALLRDWRIDRYYMGKAKLFDLSWQHRELRAAEGSSTEPGPD